MQAEQAYIGQRQRAGTSLRAIAAELACARVTVRAFRAVGGRPLIIERGEGACLSDADSNMPAPHHPAAIQGIAVKLVYMPAW